MTSGSFSFAFDAQMVGTDKHAEKITTRKAPAARNPMTSSQMLATLMNSLVSPCLAGAHPAEENACLSIAGCERLELVPEDSTSVLDSVRKERSNGPTWA
ncbi:MAG: hypothetical protein ABI769_19305 [Pseudomonadota bacterium]